MQTVQINREGLVNNLLIVFELRHTPAVLYNTASLP